MTLPSMPTILKVDLKEVACVTKSGVEVGFYIGASNKIILRLRNCEEEVLSEISRDKQARWIGTYVEADGRNYDWVDGILPRVLEEIAPVFIPLLIFSADS